ncbi:MAG: hypothetical protein V2A54_09975, partial [Bacteroidota bacterium]
MSIVNLRKQLFQIFLLGFLIIGSIPFSFGQGSEDGVKAEAAKLFEKGDYAGAMPKYSQLLSLNPRDPEYNYRFGVCLFYSNANAEAPVKYLMFAKKELPQKAEIYYYLGRVYHLNYRFTEAMQMYTQFQTMAPQLVKKVGVAHSIEMCRNGISLLSKINDIYVFQKREVREAGFYRSFDAACFGGRFYPKSDELKTKLDRKMESGGSLMFVLNSKKEIYYASFGKKGETGKDIYHVTKLPDGKWGEPERLSDAINTIYDEDFPYLQPDGKTLYFSSKGHNSMGGYDIFRTIYNTKEKKWVKPVNMDFAINTPYDEMLFVPDTLEQYAFFSSNRLNTRGNVTLFKVRIDKRPDKTENIDLANISTSPSDTAELMKTIALLNAKASLDVNATEEMFVPAVTQYFDNTTPVDTTSEIDHLLDSGNLSNADIISIAQKEADKAKGDAIVFREKYNASVALSAQKNKEADDLKNEADKLLKQAQNTTDPVQKDELEQQAAGLQNQSVQKKKEGALAYNIAVKYKNALHEKSADADDQGKYVAALQKANDSKDPKKSNEALTNYINYLQKSDSTGKKYATMDLADIAPTKDDYNLKKKEADDLQNQLKSIKESVGDLESQAQNLRNDANRTKKKDTKDALNKQANDLDEQAKNLNESLNPLVASVNKANREADSVLNELKVVSGVLRNISDSSKQLSTVKVSDADKNALDNEFRNKNHLTVAYNAYKPENTAGTDNSVKEANVRVKTIRTKRDSLANARDIAYALALEKDALSKKNSDDADRRLGGINNLSGSENKRKELNAINRLLDDAKRLQGESRIVFEIAQKLDSAVKDADDALAQAEEISNNLSSNKLSADEVNEKLNELKNIVASVENSIRIIDLAPVVIKDTKDNAVAAQNNAESTEQKIQTLKNRLNEMQAEAKNPNTKKKRRTELETQMEGVRNDIQAKTKELNEAVITADRLKNDAALMENAAGYDIKKDWNAAKNNNKTVSEDDKNSLRNTYQSNRIAKQKDSVLNVAAANNVGINEATSDNTAKLEANVNSNIDKQNGNKTILNTLQAGNRNQPEAIEAKQLVNESDQLVQKANALLADAKNTTDINKKSDLLSEADDLSNKALEKQLRAIELYQKNY